MLPCPCCGYRTLPEPGDGASLLCEVCAWEDRDPDGGWSGAPRYRLAEAQRDYDRSGASDPELRDFIRAPRPEEARPSWWLSIDDAPAALIAEIEEAFAGVELDGGVSFAEAELIDDYALPSRTEHDQPPRGHGVGPPWQELTREELDRYSWGNFSFQDARGIRYHLPAFMREDLRALTAEALARPRHESLGRPGAIDSLMFALRSGHQLDAVERLLDDAQRRAVARYLAFLATAHPRADLSVVRSLHTRWGAYLDPDQRAALPSW